ncbi:EAL domain-containing protein [Bradyrhizobium sp.]|uniref:bifunctional diguanylate cyclase/phosphodiesterase n=1 Tax=Bradyrhizobium sp. TaxID=376 RepID=UPI0025BF5B26|nr:EAL domain-containing protein [Bradyrhizobium sp.]
MRETYRRLAHSPGSSLMALGVLLSLAAVVLFVLGVEARYSDRIAAAKSDALSFANILAEHTVLTFEDIDRALREAESIRRASLAGRFDSTAATAALRQLHNSSSVIIAIGWTDASGQVVAHSFDHAPSRPDISGMAHFIAQRDSTGDRLSIAPPFRSLTDDRWFTAASRRLSNPDGSFAGIVTAPLDQSYFTKLYRSIDLGKAGSILLVHRNGQLLAREPGLKDALGTSLANGPLLTRYLPASETGAYETTSVVDGVDRIVGYKAVPGLPLVVAVTYARSEVLQQWYRNLYTFGVLVAAFVAIIMLGTFVLVRRTNALARTNARFDSAINNMSQGLCLFDADKRLVISNSRFQTMYGLPDELVLPGTPLKRIYQFYADRGESRNMTVDQRLELIATQPRLSYERADGRVIDIQRTPTPDGGWVATHEDVTVQRRAEQLLAEKATELEATNLRFDAALNNMSQGLCMFDAEQKVVVSNARYGEIYHLSRDQIKPGTSLRQILEYRRAMGTNFNVAPETYLTQNVKAAKEVLELADGRVVAIARHAMPNGGWLTTHEDITDRARNEKRIAFLAQHDLLTGLANRALFSEKLEDAAKRLQRHGTAFTVLMLDLDKFKNVNDTLGHSAGDQLLVEVAQRLRTSIRDLDVLARLGGDEFAIIQENENVQGEGAVALALRIIRLIEQPFDLGGQQVNVGTSIGISFAPEHGVDAETLLHKADLALYAAKSGGRNAFRVFEPGLTEAADIQRSIEGELRDAISRNEFELHYQPMIDATVGRIFGVEAFVRWHHPSRGLLAPDRFLPLAESTGLMQPLGEWILRQACMDAAAWPADIRIAVNVSAVQFANGNLFELVLAALVDSGLSPLRLELEIADTSLLQKDQAEHLATIRQLKNLGVSIVLDNCGAGYSSASYLASFPFDKIKIDKSVAQGFENRRDCAALVASVLALARGLDIATAAKGIESRTQYEALLAAGVDFAQGYLFGRPVPHSELDLDAVFPLAKNVA